MHSKKPGKTVFLANPPYDAIYEKSIIHLFKFVSNNKGDRSLYPPQLGLSTIAPAVVNSGHNVRIFDLNIPSNGQKFAAALETEKPDYVGITFTTPLYNEALKILESVKKHSPGSITIGGGPHTSAFPEKTIRLTKFDIVVMGEGDYTLSEIVNGKPLERIKGIAYKKKGRVFVNPRKEFIHDLDALPFPAWQLFDVNKYNIPKAVATRNKVGPIETSRGCPWGCVYCTKSVFGRNFRVKSPDRVIEEIKYMLEQGFEEIHIADDGFTTQIERAEAICDKIIDSGLKFPWATITGIRADRVTLELLKKMKKAGCYRVYYGIETGNEDIMKRINKGETLEAITNAVKMSKRAGLEVYGFFMIGLPGETEETMQQTIDFAKELRLDMAKISITSPLPSTPLYEEYLAKGLIKSDDWSSFNVYSIPENLYDHENLEWYVIENYYKKFYYSFYLNPGFMIRRVAHSIRNRTLISDLSVFINFLKKGK
jgi:anaerobic magnesium-protoporphyrin IX monomethyl ester cyclase